MTLGSIVVRLTMNTADFDTDSKRAASIAEKRAKEIDASFRKAGVAIGLALSAGLAIGTRAIKESIDRMDDLSKAAKTVGMPTDEFSRLAYAADLANVSQEELQSGLGRLVKAQAAALDTSSKQAAMFKSLGIEVVDASGKMRNTTDVMLDFADVFSDMKGSPEALAAGLSIFGRGFQTFVPLINDGSAAIRELMGEADALGVTLSTETGNAAELFNDNLTRLQRTLGGVVMEIASGMLPQLNDMTGDMVIAAKETDNLREFGEGLVTVLGGLGSGFSFVAGMARQFTIDTLASADALAGYIEAAQNISSLGAAPGSVSGGMARASNAWDTRRGLLGDIAAQRQRAEAQADIDRMLRNGVKYDGPLLEDGSQGKKGGSADEIRRRLLAALADSGSASKKAKPKAAELTDEQKAAKALNEEYMRTAEGLRERLGLMGLETEAAKMKWETEEGSFKALDPMRKAELIAQAALVDAKKTAMELAEDERRANEDAQKSYQAAIADIQMERDTLGMTNEQLEIYNRLKWAGVDANSAFGRSIVDQAQDLQKARKAMGQQIEAMDAFRQEGSNFLQDLAAGVKPIDALTDALDGLAAKLQQMIADNLMEKFFGQMGSSSTGSSGGGIWDMLGGLFGSFLGAGGGGASASTSGAPAMLSWMQGGYSRGGYTGAGGMFEPAGTVHKGEVVWSKGDVARAGGVGAVEGMRRGRGGRGEMTIYQSINVPANTSYDTAQQAGQAAYAGAGRAARRNGG